MLESDEDLAKVGCRPDARITDLLLILRISGIGFLHIVHEHIKHFPPRDAVRERRPSSTNHRRFVPFT